MPIGVIHEKYYKVASRASFMITEAGFCYEGIDVYRAILLVRAVPKLITVTNNEDGTFYRLNGERHCEDGPAVELTDGTKALVPTRLSATRATRKIITIKIFMIILIILGYPYRQGESLSVR